MLPWNAVCCPRLCLFCRPVCCYLCSCHVLWVVLLDMVLCCMCCTCWVALHYTLPRRPLCSVALRCALACSVSWFCVARYNFYLIKVSGWLSSSLSLPLPHLQEETFIWRQLWSHYLIKLFPKRWKIRRKQKLLKNETHERFLGTTRVRLSLVFSLFFFYFSGACNKMNKLCDLIFLGRKRVSPKHLMSCLFVFRFTYVTLFFQ